MKTQKPWTDKAGNPLSDEELKAVSRGWSQETWNEYLETVEYSPRPGEEVSYGDMRHFEGGELLQLADLLPSTDHLSDELLGDVKRAVEELPARQRLVMEEELYLDKGQRTIASQLGVSRTLVRKIRKKAYANLAKKLAKYRPA